MPSCAMSIPVTAKKKAEEYQFTRMSHVAPKGALPTGVSASLAFTCRASYARLVKLAVPLKRRVSFPIEKGSGFGLSDASTRVKAVSSDRFRTMCLRLSWS